MATEPVNTTRPDPQDLCNYGSVGVLNTRPDSIQCHVCGEWWTSLAAHAQRSHGLSADGYRAAFGLMNKTKLVAPALREAQADSDQFTVVTCNCIDCFAAKSTPALAEMYRVLQPGGRVLVADDHSDEMESIGFTDVSVEHVLWGDCTTRYKQAV